MLRGRESEVLAPAANIEDGGAVANLGVGAEIDVREAPFGNLLVHLFDNI